MDRWQSSVGGQSHMPSLQETLHWALGCPGLASGWSLDDPAFLMALATISSCRLALCWA